MTEIEIAATSGSVCVRAVWEGTRGIHLGGSYMDVHTCKVYLCISRVVCCVSVKKKTRTVAQSTFFPAVSIVGAGCLVEV